MIIHDDCHIALNTAWTECCSLWVSTPDLCLVGCVFKHEGKLLLRRTLMVLLSLSTDSFHGAESILRGRYWLRWSRNIVYVVECEVDRALCSYLSDSNCMHLQTVRVYNFFSYHILAIGAFSLTYSVWINSLLTQSFIKPNCCACYEHIFKGQTFEKKILIGLLEPWRWDCSETSVTNCQSTLLNIQQSKDLVFPLFHCFVIVWWTLLQLTYYFCKFLFICFNLPLWKRKC